MRTLDFIVDGQILKQDPDCDFSGLVPGSEHYLKARFTFSPEWTNTVKVIAFWSRLGREFAPQVLKADSYCDIPFEALESKHFKIQVIGKKKDGLKLQTNKLEICQNGG